MITRPAEIGDEHRGRYVKYAGVTVIVSAVAIVMWWQEFISLF